jgi:DNA-binding response OmpR family regulator
MIVIYEVAQMRILVVEDEESLAAVLQKRLTQEGYSVDKVGNGEDALLYIEMGAYDCIVLDMLLPKKSGMQVLKTIRQNKNHTPVLILTANDAINDRVAGLDAGADDYLIKPFAHDELSARIRVLLRRNSEQKTVVLEFADLKMDTITRTVTRGAVDISLSAKEYALLEYFMRNPYRVLTRGQIIDSIWNFEFDSDSNIVDVYIRYLRTKIDTDFDTKLIHTVRGIGYVLKDK